MVPGLDDDRPEADGGQEERLRPLRQVRGVAAQRGLAEGLHEEGPELPRADPRVQSVPGEFASWVQGV